ncbi:hypothetical protein [Actinokineospora bangkokensis]|uniref:Uncharacterized protein n=1 Tax=Actinokineospora bangkokensis TaxID=1193682 RepID=A0A1Q9LT16_9PSEU|nr:hypothetical protein [Actinokineospora bangkokensis]OLR95150.1 hypothetical protein BJP25_07570 [Actinokineospora bangkokensis]
MSASGSAHSRDVLVEVAPGGALLDLRIDEPALRRGGQALAQELLELVRRATAVADQRARHTLGLTDRDAEVLGLTADTELTEHAEATTPDTWRAQ